MHRPVHPLRLCLLLVMVIFCGVLIMLANLDLEYFRSEINYTLSQALGRDVRLGKVHFSLQPGLSLTCDDLSIGGGDDFQVQADSMVLGISARHLLRGELTWTGLKIIRPQVTMRKLETKAEAEESSTGQSPLNRLLTNLILPEITVVEGEVTIGRDNGQPGRSIHLTQVNLDLRPDQEKKVLQVMANTLVDQPGWRPARIDVQGGLGLSTTDWQILPVDLTVQVAAISLEKLIESPIGNILETAGGIGISARFKGDLGNGLMLESEIDASAWHPRQFPEIAKLFPSLRLDAQVGLDESLLTVSALKVSSGPHSFSGNLSLASDNRDFYGSKLSLTGNLRLELGSLAPAFARLLPQDFTAAFNQGELELRQMSLTTPLRTLADPRMILNTLSSDLALVNGAGSIHGETLSGLRCRARFEGGQLSIADLGGEWLSTPFTATGTVQVAGNDPALDLSVESNPDLPEILKHFTIDLPVAGRLEGITPLKFWLGGPVSTPKFRLQADLTRLAIEILPAIVKKPGTSGQLSLKGELFPDPIIDQATLELQPFAIQATGTLPLAKGKSFSLDLESSRLSLARLSDYLPVLEPFRLRGEAVLNYRLEGTGASLANHFGRITLNGAGAHLTRVIADLNDISGTALLSEKGGRSLPLKGKIGGSPVTLQTNVRLTEPFRVEIHVQGKTVRAHDLIFPSEKALLRDLDGRVAIHPGGIDFEEVRVRLDGGTRAVVKGAMIGWHPPRVVLDIGAEYGDIDEVIALWSDGPDRPHHTDPSAVPTTVDIDITAQAGKIGPLKFTEASTHLSHDGRGLLRIHPIRFRHQSGFGVAQVLADSRDNQPSRLHISGHVEDFPAESIYNDVLQRESLLTGTMRGDFYLTGLTGKSFLETSFGGFALEIHDGVLRKFKVLSKVFSLLNVSQILTFQAPDMATEGMPFEKITGTFKLEGGLLQNEDLWVHSEAMDMSLVGNYDIPQTRIDALLGIKPLKTVDKIITRLPIAGWLLAGEERSLVTAHFQITGSAADPEVTAVPITSVSGKVFDIFKRVLQLPGKVITDPGEVFIPPAAQPNR